MSYENVAAMLPGKPFRKRYCFEVGEHTHTTVDGRTNQLRLRCKIDARDSMQSPDRLEIRALPLHIMGQPQSP